MTKKKHTSHQRRKNSKKKKQLQVYKGKITITPAGFGFIIQDDSEQDIFIPPQYISCAMDGDIVKAKELDEAPRRGRRNSNTSRGPVAKVVKIIERTRTKIVGELLAGQKMRPLNRRLPEISIEGDCQDAERGDWIEAELPDIKDKSNITSVKYIRSIGKVDSVQSDIDAVIAEYSLKPRYTEEQNTEAGLLTPSPIDRKDITELYCLTIDPIDAKDFDDAVSISPGKNKGEIELGVHIADVSGFVTPGSYWDEEAEKRGFTAYIPCNTLPMLPPSLTRNASLTTGEPSPAHTVILTIDKKTGKVLSSRRMFSLVKIAKRLTFDEVQDAINGKPPEGWNKKLIKTIKELSDLTKTMREYRRQTEDFLELATVEIRVICDDKEKELLGIKKKVQQEADMLIEECMLAANVAVAEELSRRKIPGLFRIHPEPTPEKILDFTIFMEETFNISPGVLDSRKACNNFLNSLPDDHNKPVIIDAFLRSLMRALYSNEPGLHFGLGKGLYSHFTSPIRRYTDLIVHQQLRIADQGGQLFGKDKLNAVAAECTEKEMNIDSAYYTANDRLKLHYIKQNMLEESKSLMEGVIQKISSFGLLVNIAQLGIVGLVPNENLHGKFYKHKGILKSENSNKSYKCGDYIYLQLEKIDMIKGMAIFTTT
jgi:ribonuclease R